MSTDFGQCLRAILREKNLTQMEAAAHFGWSQRTISYYCNSFKPPRPHILALMSARLGVSVEALLGGSGEALVCVVREPPVPYSPPASSASYPLAALDRLRTFYRAASPEQRAVIRADLRRLFPKHYKAVESWLKLA